VSLVCLSQPVYRQADVISIQLTPDVMPPGDAGKFLDYPTLGVDASALYIGGVRFNPNVAY
jgi:hypothetical protein